MKSYRKRIADETLRFKLECKGAVLVEGAKWCGKTTTALQAAKSVVYLQDLDRAAHYHEIAQANPSLLLEGAVPHLIDEWQMEPQLWDAVRFAVDQRDDFGQFILTGSATPADKTKIHHSGVGRITKMLMRPMSLFESGDSSGAVSLKKLFEGEEPQAVVEFFDLPRLAFLICRGGWPKAVEAVREQVALEQARDYFQIVVDNDISRVDGVARSADRASQLLRAYARGVSTQTTLESLVQDMGPEESASRDTVRAYLESLRKIFVIEEAPAWHPNLRSKTAIRESPTRYFTDPSVGTAALGIGPGDLLNDLNTMGLFFENLCVRDLRVYAEANDGEVRHYRDRNGLECDAVVHLRNGTYALVEIKLGGQSRIDEGAASLLKLEKNLDTSRMKPPAFKMVLTGLGEYAYRRTDGVFVVPVSALRD